MGIPLFPLALFLLWGGLIAMLAWLMEWPEDRLANRNAERPDDRAEAPPPPAPPQE